MLITKDIVCDTLLAYLNYRLTLAQLVDWAETMLCEGELVGQIELLSDVLARLGLADVREFGLSWDDCTALLARLGYQAQVQAMPLAA